MQRNHAFTLTEMWTAILLVSLVLICAHAMIDGGGVGLRAQARRSQSSTHVRGIQSGMILFCNGNKDHYPGVHHTGAILTDPIPARPPMSGRHGEYGTDSVSGADVVYRMTVLLRGNYFSPAYMRSPAETNPAIVVVPAPTAAAPLAVVKDGTHYSYAMLNISNRDAGRCGEWRATNNSLAAVITDRNIGDSATGKTAQSVHTKPGEGWKGAVCWNDNHATFEESDAMKTEYALKGAVAADRLFSEAEKSASNIDNADAAMVFKAGNSYVDQQP